MSLIADIIINRPTRQLNRAFSYEVPDEFGRIPEGTRVAVPLGNKEEEGIIIGYREETSYTLKSISRILDKTPWFTSEMLETARKVSDYYLCGLPQALEFFTIDKKNLKEYTLPLEKWIIPVQDNFIDGDWKRKPKQLALLKYIYENGPLPMSAIKAAGFSSSIINALLKTNFLQLEMREKNTKTRFQRLAAPYMIPLNEQQTQCFLPIKEAMQAHRQETFLLHGVTGSGKTQVYLQAAKECISSGKTCIVLVPEIILTIQIVERFVRAFGDEVVVFHSKLTKLERYNNWERLRRGESHIIIGARSAVFAPAEDIGLIIIDEEHDGSYKQEDMGHYHARKVALWRAEAHHCPLLLGSATPSLESYEKALRKEYTLLEMKERAFLQPQPDVSIVDMKEELFFGNYTVLSQALRELISNILKEKKQMIILLNRRGYSTFLLCRTCGKPIECPNCDTSLIYHKQNEHLRCHYCDHHERVPTICPHCGSNKIKFFGSGTQKVEEELRKSYPKARIARLDQDVTSKKGEGDKILEDFKSGNYDILLGTQMVSKGHDFENVLGVGILTADSVLNIPLYSAAERTFALLTQTVGRAGRGLEKGKAVIQTYNPSHYAIIYSKTQNYLSFFLEEIEARRALAYPPFASMIHLLLQKQKREDLEMLALKVESLLQSYPKLDEEDIELCGPYDNGAQRVRNIYRTSFMIRGKNLTNIKIFLKESWLYTQPDIIIDVDPI